MDAGFRLACRYTRKVPGQVTFLTELKQTLDANIGCQRILSYFNYLDGALLIRIVPPLEVRLKKRKGNSKLCIVDHALRQAGWERWFRLTRRLAETPHLADVAGRFAESVAGAFLGGIPHLDLAHFPERTAEPEIDYILTVGEKRILLGVKYRRGIDPRRDSLGLRFFLEKTAYNAPFGVLVTMEDDLQIPDPRVVPISLRSLLLMR